MSGIGDVPAASVGLQLYRIQGEELLACEPVHFLNGWDGVETVLRRAAISGRVEVGGELLDHFADINDEHGDTLGTVALDADSYRALKYRWMPCRMEHS